jgi:membrane protein DedA with SNARE-associated domain
MDELVVRLVELGGYWGIFFLMIAENLFPPIPSELIMGMGGVFVARGTMEFWPLMLAGTAGTVLGNYAWYYACDKLGYKRLRPLVDRWGRWLTLDWDDVEKASAFFRRHGQWVIFVMRFSPFLRTLISVPAGLTHMPKGRFILFTTAGSAIWNAALIKGGELLGQNLKNAEQVIAWFTIFTIVVLAAWYLWRVATWKPKPAGNEG